MKIAKSFTWEMGHRLPFHNGKCVHLHGHSYRAEVELTGEPDSNGILMDYYDLKVLMQPVIEKMDHAFMVYEQDTAVIAALDGLGSKALIVPFHSTAENIAAYICGQLAPAMPPQIATVRVRLYETADAYAESVLER